MLRFVPQNSVCVLFCFFFVVVLRDVLKRSFCLDAILNWRKGAMFVLSMWHRGAMSLFCHVAVILKRVHTCDLDTV